MHPIGWGLIAVFVAAIVAVGFAVANSMKRGKQDSRPGPQSLPPPK